MSAIGSSVVNKSGKKLAPKAPARRRPGATASSASARSSVDPAKQTEADRVSRDTIISEVVRAHGITTFSNTTSSTAEIANIVEPAAKRRKLGEQSSVREAVGLSKSSIARSSLEHQLLDGTPKQAYEAHAESVNYASQQFPHPLMRISEFEQMLPTPPPTDPEGSNTANRVSSATSSRDKPSSVTSSGPLTAGNKTASGFVDVVPYEIPSQVASQITWNLRTGKTTDEAVGPSIVQRKSTRLAAEGATKNDNAKARQPATSPNEQENAQSTVTHSPDGAPAAKGKTLRKNKGREPMPVDPQVSSASEHQADDEPSTTEANTAPKPRRPSARVANRQRRQRKATERQEAEASIVPTTENLPAPESETADQTNTEAAPNGEGSDVTIVKKKQRNPRAGTPEGLEAVQIVPSVVTMFELSARNIRTGWKSEREKLMAQIDWKEVKRRQMEEEKQLAEQGRFHGNATGAKANGDNGGNHDGEWENEDEDIDERLSRAVARNQKKQQTLKIRLVNGEHVIDESSQFVDRHALAHAEEDEDVLEEVEEDDLTRKFNTQSLIRMRRKDPQERIRNWDRWTMESTDIFYDCLRKFGTDFMVIAKCFPNRTRREIKSKFIREERDDPERVHAALMGARNGNESWDLEDFKKLNNLGREKIVIVDPRQLEEELKRTREEREKEIEERRKETAELERQKKLAGVVDSDDEAGGESASSDMDQKRRGKKKKKSKKKRKNSGKKKAKGPKDGGDEVEILEELSD
jgi:transcription factor TFIIIB component B''